MPRLPAIVAVVGNRRLGLLNRLADLNLALEVPDPVKEKILWANAERLLGL